MHGHENINGMIRYEYLGEGYEVEHWRVWVIEVDSDTPVGFLDHAYRARTYFVSDIMGRDLGAYRLAASAHAAIRFHLAP